MSASAPQVDPQTCAQTFLRRVTRELELSEQRARMLRSRAKSAAEILRTQGAAEIWLFGSLAGGQPHLGSDVDLLIRGIPERQWQQTMRVVERDFPDVALDLVRYEDAPQALTALAQQLGERLA